jgi:predicted small lipoprotein YifL
MKIVLIAFVLLSVAACGRKGALEAPQGARAAPETPTQTLPNPTPIEPLPRIPPRETAPAPKS